ncbi:MAG: hypothetical protein H7833_06085 [Magnetococcus sp. DMHC-1]
MPSVLSFACTANDAYCDSCQAPDAEMGPFIAGWLRAGEFVKQEYLGSGFFGRAYKNRDSSEVIIAYRGTELTDFGDLNADRLIATGQIPEGQISQALLLFDDVSSVLGGKSIFLTGHSLGGFLAAYVAIVKGVPSVIFNAPGLTLEMVKRISPYGSCDQITHFRAIDDIISKVGSLCGTVFDIDLSTDSPIANNIPYNLGRAIKHHSMKAFVKYFQGRFVEGQRYIISQSASF